MSKRFKALNTALKYLATSDADDNPQAPTGTYLRKYQDWKSGARDIEYTREAASKPQEILQAELNPFGLAETAANAVLVALSKRASLASIGNTMKTACNYETENLGETKKLAGFIPAKATVFIGVGTTSGTPETSKITGAKYKKRGGASYTFPYGASTTKPREGEVRTAILTALASNTNASVSFTSEKL